MAKNTRLLEHLMDGAIIKLELGRTHLEYGEVALAAKCLREAADFLERAAQVREKALRGLAKGV